MNILFFSHYYPPEGNAPATRVSALARRWVQAGHAVTVITGVPNVPDGKIYPGYQNRFFPSTEFVDGVRVIRVWTYLAPNKGVARRILNYVSYMISAFVRATLLKAPDIFIATSPQFFCGWAGVLYNWHLKLTWVLRRRSTPFVLEIRDLWPESIHAVAAIKSAFALRFLQWMEKTMYGQAAHIVTVGDGYKRQLTSRGVPDSKISVNMNGVDNDILSKCEVNPSAVRSQYNLGDAFVCAYIGTIGLACGLEIILRAGSSLMCAQNERIKFLIVGDGATRKELEQEAARRGLTNVVFTGRQPKESIAGFLAASDVCLVHLKKTDLFETVIPSKIFEAFGMSRPIIVGVGGDARKLIEDSGGGVAIEPENDHQLLVALQQMLEQPKKRLEMGEAGRRYVLKNFDRDQLAADYLQVLEECIQSKSRECSKS